MQKENHKENFRLLTELVNGIGSILQIEGINAKVDFDHRDGIVIVKYQISDEYKETVCIIDHNYKVVKGIDTTDLWMPDYSKLLKVTRKLSNLFKKKGYRIIDD